MRRELKPAQAAAYNIVLNRDTDPVKQLRAYAPGYSWLLAHSETGVTWGRVTGDTLTTPVSYAPVLDQDILWQARLFGDLAELLLWRDGDGLFHARILGERTPAETKENHLIAKYAQYFDETQILWGNGAIPATDAGFTIMSDGAEGLEHVAPFATVHVRNGDRPLRLKMRHYVNEDEMGFNRIVASRLVDLYDDNDAPDMAQSAR